MRVSSSKRGQLAHPDDQYDLRDGHALAWIDPLFYHSTYLRAGRALDDLKPLGRSIILLREIVGTVLDAYPMMPNWGVYSGFPGERLILSRLRANRASLRRCFWCLQLRGSSWLIHNTLSLPLSKNGFSSSTAPWAP